MAPHEVRCCDSGTPFRIGAPGGLGPREAARLCDAGLLRRVLLDVHVPADVPDEPLVRASALMCLVPRRLVVAGGVVALTAAAWVLAGGSAPRTVDVFLPPHRNLPGNRSWLQVHQRRLAGTDTVLCGSLRLTDPLRTAADLARRQEPPADLAVLRALGQLGHFTARDLEARLAREAGRRWRPSIRGLLSAWAETDPQADLGERPASSVVAPRGDGSGASGQVRRP